MPVAMEAMAKAAQDAGISTSGTVKELGELMKKGEVASAKVLPFFAKQLRLIANDNDALSIALEKNLSPALGRATLGLQEMQDAIFKGGLKDSIMFLLSGFSKMTEEAGSVAKGIGAFLGGALFGLTFPIRLVTAALLDLKFIITDTFGIDNETEEWFFRVAGAAAGLAATIGGAIFALKKLKQVKDVVTSSGTTLEKGGVDKGKGSIFNLRGHTPAKPLFVSIVGDTDVGGFTKDKTKTSKKPKKMAGLAKGAIGAAALGAAGALFFGVLPESGKGESFSAESILGEDFALLDKPFLKQPIITNVSPSVAASGFGAAEMFRKEPIKVDVTVIPDPELGNIMTVKAEEAQQNMISNARMSMGARGE